MRMPGLLGLALLAGCSTVSFHTEDRPAMRAALEAAHLARIDGPTEVRAAAGTYVRIEEGCVWIPAAQGRELLRAMGAPGGEMLGMVVADASDAAWYAVIVSSDRVAGWHNAPALRGLSRK